MSGDLAQPRPIALLEWNESIQIVETEYEVKCSPLFPGSKRVGIPKYIKLVAEVDDAINAGSVRIYDLTNSLEIAELTGIDAETKTVYDMGTLSNIPEDEAVWEIQGEVTAGELELYSVVLIF